MPKVYYADLEILGYQINDGDCQGIKLEPNKRIWGIPIYLLQRHHIKKYNLSEAINALHLVEVFYLAELDGKAFARKGIPATIVRLQRMLAHIYWGFVWHILYKRLHLIDRRGSESMEFSWLRDFKFFRLFR